MSQGKHWREDGAPPDFERLLRASRNEHPSPASVQRALAAAGMAGTTSLASGAAAASAGSATGKAMMGAMIEWFALGVMGAGAVVATAEVVGHGQAVTSAASTDESSGSARRMTGQETGASVERPVASAAARETPVPMADSTNAAPSAASPTVPAEKMPTVPAPAATSPDRTLLEEMALVDGARSRLRAGDASGALRSAGEYGRRFPGGRFAPEALFLVMQARTALGQRQAAADVAREIVRRFPNGAQVERARELLRSQGATENP